MILDTGCEKQEAFIIKMMIHWFLKFEERTEVNAFLNSHATC